MTMFEVIRMVAVQHGCTPDDGWIEEIADRIFEDNDVDSLTIEDVIELTEQFFEEDE